jgi:signal recognition particle subunit SRP54
MGNMKDLVGMIPGASKAMKDVEIEDDAFKHIRHPFDAIGRKSLL